MLNSWEGGTKNVHCDHEDMIIYQGKTKVDNHIRPMNILTITISRMLLSPRIFKKKRWRYLPVCLSRYLLNHWAEFYLTCYITSLHGKGVREQHYISVRPCVRRPSTCLSHYLPLNQWAEFNQSFYITSSQGKVVREQYYISVRPSSVRAFVVHPSVRHAIYS